MKWLSIQAHKPSLHRATALVFLAAVVGSFFSPVLAADSFVQSFKAKSNLEPGWVVALDQKDANSVEIAPASDSGRIYGVVVDPSEVPFTIQKKPGQQVFVATTGTYSVLVNDENGIINPGDFISLSTTNGIAAKAVAGQSYVLGKAIEKFDGQSGVITKDSGRALGRIHVTIAPSKNPLQKSDVAVPGSLKKLGEGIAGRDVAAIRIYTALAIFFITAAVAAIVLWVGVRGGMIAIGRNPLSRKHIIKSLVQVIAIAILIFVVGVVGVYLLLKL